MSYGSQRRKMVDEQVKAHGVEDSLVLAAMRSVPREKFVPQSLRYLAYEDGPLPIGCGQTISQPAIVGTMTEALELKADDKVLEVGTGSGYQAAILSEIAGEVYSIERVDSLARTARKLLAQLGYENAHVITGDGSLGLEQHAPFDAIIVTAGVPEVPKALVDQLAIGGRLIVPVGDNETYQELIRIRRIDADNIKTDVFVPVRFVPLIGAAGWSDTGYRVQDRGSYSTKGRENERT